MTERRDTTRMILYAAARVLGCGSVQMSLLDEQGTQLIFTTGITNRDLPRLYQIESVLGFPLEGAKLPLASEDNVIVRAYREERLMLSEDVADLVGRALPPEGVESIRRAIGPRAFAAVPIPARGGTLGVLIFERPGETGWSTEERDLLVAYADRVGADLESQALSDDVKRLEAIGEGVVDPFEREELRREVSRAREHLTKVLRSVADVILTIDANGRVASGNEAVAQAFGVPPSELVGREAYELCADERSQKRARELTLEARASGFAEGELRLKRKRSAFVAEVSALLLADDEGGPAGVLWRVHDLTERRRGDAERKRLRARLLQSERLSALGEMAARIAHEVRNPLVSIGAAAQVVAEELGPENPVAGEVQAIVREVRRLDAIVSDFLRFARPRRAERREVDLAPVVEESADLVRKKAQNEIAVARDGALIVRCDPDAIKQVLLNVLLNAVEAAPGSKVECEARLYGDQVVVSVADRGPGIPDSARKRVFDPFFSTKSRGTGLGLAVSKQIVDEHEGRIRLLPRRGGGTRVVIELPVG